MNLLALRLSALGDVIHTIPAVVALKAQHDVTWCVEAPYRELVEIVAGVKTIPVSLKKWWRSPRVHKQEIRGTWRALHGFDASIDFQGLVKSALLGRLSGAKLRYGFDRDAIREKPALWFTNRRVPVDRSGHVVEWNLELARALVPGAPMPDVDFSSFAQGTYDATGSVVLLPGAGKANKLWPVDHFRQLVKQLGDQALVVWGPGERELAEAIGGRLAPPTNLRELAYILRQASVVVGADTGPLHLAAALGTSVIGLYGPTNPRRNGPFGQLDRVISTFEGEKVMQVIPPEAVLGKIDQAK